MALCITVKAGGYFYIEDRPYQVAEVYSPEEFRLETKDKEFEITGGEAVEVEPDVFISAGTSRHPIEAKVVIEAPRSIEIWREVIWKKKYGVSN